MPAKLSRDRVWAQLYLGTISVFTAAAIVTFVVSAGNKLVMTGFQTRACRDRHLGSHACMLICMRRTDGLCMYCSPWSNLISSTRYVDRAYPNPRPLDSVVAVQVNFALVTTGFLVMTPILFLVITLFVNQMRCASPRLPDVPVIHLDCPSLRAAHPSCFELPTHPAKPHVHQLDAAVWLSVDVTPFSTSPSARPERSASDWNVNKVRRLLA